MMESLFERICELKKDRNWCCFRFAFEELTGLVAAMRAVDENLREIAIPACPDRMVLYSDGKSPTLFVAEPLVHSPAAFVFRENTYSVGFAEGPAVGSFLELMSMTEAVQPGPEKTGNRQKVSLRTLIENAVRYTRMDLECRVRRLAQNEHGSELEGEDFFANLSRRINDLLSPDYLEIQLESPSDYWADRSPGWVWSESRFAGQLLSILISPKTVRQLYQLNKPLFLSDLASSQETMNRDLLRIMGLHSGYLLPVVHRGDRMGIVKLLYSTRLIPFSGEDDVLDVIREILTQQFDSKRRHLQTQRLATVDGVTNLFNHRFFREQLGREFRRARRYKKPLSLIMIDIDDFKSYNDTYGHLAGDHVLGEVANTIRRTVRDIDFVARYGGEEFALILPEVTAKNGVIVAEKIRKAVESKQYCGRDGKSLGSLTVSCGVSDNQNAKDAEELIQRSDRAMYWVKRHGRNLVRLETADGTE